MDFDPDEYLKQAPATAAAPPSGFDPDAYLAAKPATPPPPEEVVPTMTPAVKNAPLPQERPLRADVAETQPMPPVTEMTDQPFVAPGTQIFEGTGSERAGMLTGEQAFAERTASIRGAEATKADAEARLAAALERQQAVGVQYPKPGGSTHQQKLAIDAEVDAAKANLDNATRGVSVAERASPPTQEASASAARGAMTNILKGIPEMAAGAARIPDAFGTDIAKYPAALVSKIEQLHPSDPTRSGQFTQQLGEGAGSMVPFMAAGVIGKGVGMSQSVASALSGGLQNAETYYKEAEAAGDKGYKKALSYVAGFAGGATEGLGSGRVMDQLDRLSGGGVKRYVGMVLKSAGEEGLQEGIQQLYDNVAKYGLWGKDPGDITEGVATNVLLGSILGAVTAGVMGAPTAISGRKAAPSAGGVPLPDQAVVTPEDIAAQVAAGGVTVDPAEVHGPPEMYGPPKPVGVPVTTATAGVETTSITEGVDDAYTMIFGPGGKPQMAPAAAGPYTQAPLEPTVAPTSIDPAAWQDAVNVEAETLYPQDVAGVHQTQAFINGANGINWAAGLEPGIKPEDVVDAYQAGQDFAQSLEFGEKPTISSGYGEGFDAIDYADPWAQTVYAETTKMFPLVDGGMTPEAAAFENGAHGLPWDMGLPTGVDQASVAMAYSSGAAFAIMKGPNAQAAQRAVPAWTQTGSQADADVLSAAYIVPVREVTRRPLTADPESNPEWTRGQETTVPGPRASYTELSVQTPAEGLVVMPITVRETVDGSPVALIEGMPAAPSEVGFMRSALWALRNNIRRIAWTGHYAPFARKLARKLGGTMGSTRVPINRPKVINMGVTVDPNSGVVTTTWGVVDPATGRPFVTTPDRSAAEEIAEKNTTYSEVPLLTLPPVAIATVQMPQSYTLEDFTHASQGATIGQSSQAKPISLEAMEPLTKALNRLIKRLNLGVAVKVVVHDGPITYQEYNKDTGKMEWVKNASLGTARLLNPQGRGAKTVADIGKAEIHVSLVGHHSAEGLWATMTHELGHIIQFTIFERASTAVRNAVVEAYRQTYFAKMKIEMTMDEVYKLQSTAAFMVDRVLRGAKNTTQLKDLAQDQVDYWTGFAEWFAEQVAKWATTSEKPLSIVDKFFKGIANRLMAMLKVASDMFGMHYEAVPALKAFLDGSLESDLVQTMAPIVSTQTMQQTTNANATQMEPEDAAVEAQVETAPAEAVIGGVFNGRPPAEAKKAKAYADRFNWMWKRFTGIHQLAAANPHIKALMAYVETIRVAQQVKQAIMTRAQDVLEKWNNLGETQADAVSALMDDVQALNFLSAEEKKRKVSRHPTMAELTAMAQKHGVTPRGLAVYAEIGKTFQEFLTRLEDVGKTEAMKISDQTRRDLKLAGIAKQIAALRSKPYFPAMRFGSYTVTIRNAAGKVIHFETFETKRQRASAIAAIEGLMSATDKLQEGYMDKSVKPLLGVPTELLELIGEKLELKAHQKDALEQLKYELSPAESFKHRFQHKKRIAGYSMDFRRAYANYFFHGANHLMKAKFADRLRALTKMAKEEAAAERDVTKRDKIVAEMTNHTKEWLDPKPDWAAVSSVAFLLNLAFSPAAAMQNLSQTLLTTHPFLASKFGHLNSVPALVKAARSLETFYKKRTLEKHSNFTQKAIFQGMQDGTIQETQAVQLAGIADGDVLGKGYGGNKVQRGWVKFNEWGSFMFQMAEQTNRRLVFRAALDLAMANPAEQYVAQSVERNKLTYDARRAEGWTEAEAAAYVTAVDATKETQFEYGKEFAPRIMRGRARSLLVFKTFQQSYWMFLVNNPGARYESLLILAFLGGFLALPWAEDLQQLLQVIAWQTPGLGKDFKLEHEARRWIIELLGSNEAGDATADLMLHGIAKRGYGIPHVMDMLAGTVGLDRSYVPTFDRSKSIAGGTFLPVELGKLFGAPLQTPEKAIAQQTQKASGAVFGYGFAAYNAMRNTQLSWTDFKRWEQMMPRAAANVSRAWRAYSEGGSRTNTGGQIVEYNVRDPQGAAEVIGMAMGYRPYRENYEWEKAMSKHDAAKLIDIQRTQIMRQFSNAVLGKDPNEISKMRDAVRNYNSNLQPEERGKAITSDSLSKSIETKARDRALQERGLPTKKGDVPIYRAEEKLYPGQHRTLRPVPGALKP